MPTKPSDHRQLPEFRPFFSTDQQSGSFGPNSAGSVANAKLEQLLRDQDAPRRKPVRDSEIYRKRQANLDKFYGSQKMGDCVRHDGYVVQLAKVASPLKVPHNLFQGKGKTEKERAIHMARIGNTYLRGKFEVAFTVVDHAVEQSEKIRSEIIQKKTSIQFKKAFGSKKNDWDFDFTDKEHEVINRPLHQAVKDLNKVCAEENMLLRLRWRTYLNDDGEKAANLFFIFPATADEVREGPRSWEGMVESHARDAEFG